MANFDVGHGEETIPLGELLGENEMPRDAMPAFPMARRGYSTVHVDAYVHEILSELERTRAQLELAGREAQAMWQRLSEIQEENDRHRAMPAFEGLGSHIDHLLTTAAEESDAIRARAHEEATSTVERARLAVESSMQTANERLADADRQARAVLADAHADAESVRREAVVAATKILARRDLGIAAIGELSRVLAEVAEEAASVQADDADAMGVSDSAANTVDALDEPAVDDESVEVVTIAEDVVVLPFDDEAIPLDEGPAPGPEQTETPKPRVI